MINAVRKTIYSVCLAMWPLVASSQTPPTITTQPTSQTVACGDDVTFSVVASGAPPLSYLWFADGQPIGMPATNATLVLQDMLFGSGTQFTVVVTNALGMVVSEPAILAVTDSPSPGLSVTSEGPANAIVSWPHSCVPFTLHSTAAMATNITTWVPVSGALKVDDFTNNVTVATGETNLSNFYWLMQIRPIITEHPEPRLQTITVGSTVTYGVVATNPPCNVPHPVFYQWRLNGIALNNETNATLTLLDAQRRNGGSYDVVAGNHLNAVPSQIASLKIAGVELALANNFADRVTTTNASHAINGNNTGATKEPLEPRHAGVLGGKSVWFSWVAPTNGIASFDTQGTAFDTVLGVYTGTNVAALNLITSDDDSGGFFTSKVQFNAVAGTEYQIAIDGLAGSSGHISVNWNLEVTSNQIPHISQQPQSQAVLFGSNAVFSVEVDSNFLPLTYQWRTNGINIQDNPTATTSTLVVTNAQWDDVARYTVVVSNTVRAVESTVAYLDLEQRTLANASLPLSPVIEFREKLDVRFDSPAEGNGLFNLGKTKPRAALHLPITSPGTIELATARVGLTQLFSSTVCYYAVSGIVYVDIIPAVNAAVMILDTQSSAPVDTVLKVRLPNGAAPWMDDIYFPFNRQSLIYVSGVRAGYTYPVTIGWKGTQSGTIRLSVSLF
jgi:hypothetical protein